MLEVMLILGIVYPSLYDMQQMYQMGLKAYLSEGSNYLDLLYLWSSIGNMLMQNAMVSQTFVCKLVMTVIFLIQIIKTMNMLKIFDPLSYIVTMLINVIFDLRVFLYFYGIMVFLFSQVFNVLGLANPNIRDYPPRENAFKCLVDYVDKTVKDGVAECEAQKLGHCDEV